ncbi:hypothetical protein RGQ29_016767 [Quercus rubra]|uniref:Uncharacterized protein n=1 Tax=Quercus rubra TaxID=3512 RepID=A0AAN7FEW9_QUERU|nr:hypothetical protein RGQ29_016767 [Quercus rubra]
MAEGALFGLAGKVLELLGSLVVQEVKLASGVKTEIENLKSRVSTIQAVLLDAEKQSSHSHQIKDWLNVLHDADGLLEDISTQVLRQKVENEAIRKRLNAIVDDRMKFNLTENCNEPQVMNRGRETYSFVLEDEVIGREDDKKEIMRRLFYDNVVENISIIPIVGIGGLGKTTLAQLLTEGKHEGSLEILQNKLREKLKGKKYLIVLDDLWNEDSSEWLLLRNLLMVGKRGSRIVLTTRSSKVAEITGTTSPHELKGLAPEKAWSLFVKIAFKEGKEPENQILVALGKQIVEKCVGVPLAIRTIGSLLYGKTIEIEWQSFLEDELSKDVENDYLGNIKSCKMHDLMHDLAIFVFGMESVILNSSGENVIEKVHHVSFDLVDSSSQFSILVANKRKIRTILVASVGGKLGNLTCDALISNLRYLRILDLHCFGLHVVPHSIGELSHLRYLDLSMNSIAVLPNSITNLLNLQTLKIYSCGSLKELPQRLKNLVNLRHLDISKCNKLTHMPLGLGHLISLEILTWFVVRQGGSKASSCSWYKKKQARSGGGLSELKELSNLEGSLVIIKLGHGEDDMLECKATNTTSSRVGIMGWWRNLDDDDDDDNEPHHLLLPSFPPCLSTLEIINCPNLISMPNLTSLKEPYIDRCPKFRLTMSRAGQICACSIEMAFETSTTKYLFDNCCYLYISMFGGGYCIGESLKMLEELNFPPLPSAGGVYIDENSYVLESYEFFPEFNYLPQCLKESHCFGFNREANRGMSAIIWPCSSSLNGYQMETI